MKLVGFVLLGLVASIVVSVLNGFWLERAFPDVKGCAGIGVALLINMPVALLLGSIVTGFLSCPSLETKWGLLGIAPGLYLAGLLIITLSMSGETAINMLIMGLYWYLASLAGVVLGYFLRARIRRWRFGEEEGIR